MRRLRVGAGLVVAVALAAGAEPAVAADCSLGQQRIQGRGASALNTAQNGVATFSYSNPSPLSFGGSLLNSGCIVDGGGLISFLPADRDRQELPGDPANTGFNNGNDLVFYDSQGGGNGMAAFGAGTGSGKHAAPAGVP